jgi:hypothetical protein
VKPRQLLPWLRRRLLLAPWVARTLWRRLRLRVWTEQGKWLENSYHSARLEHARLTVLLARHEARGRELRGEAQDKLAVTHRHWRRSEP